MCYGSSCGSEFLLVVHFVLPCYGPSRLTEQNTSSIYLSIKLQLCYYCQHVCSYDLSGHYLSYDPDFVNVIHVSSTMVREQVGKEMMKKTAELLHGTA